MNVAIFTDNDFQKVNGVTTVLRAVLEHAPADVKPRIYTCDADGADRPGYLALKAAGVGIPYYSEMKMYFPPLARFISEAKRDGVDLIHLTTPGPVGLAALWASSRLGIPLVGSFHTHLAEYTARLSGSRWLGNLMREYMRWPYGRCQQILVPSEATRQVLIDSKLDATKLRIWARGVSTERFSPARRSDALRQAWGASHTSPALIYVGRLSKEKGLGELPALQQSLRAAGVQHRLVLVGDGPMRAELERRCPDAFFTGTLSHDAVAVSMASADLFVFPSRTDTAGNVVLEAQASGLPVLVTNEGGPQENLLPGLSGEVCDSTSDFAVHATRLLTNREHRAAQSCSARAFALGRRWDRSLQPLFRAYRDVAATGKASWRQASRGNLRAAGTVELPS